jgi:hypothetical protein
MNDTFRMHPQADLSDAIQNDILAIKEKAQELLNLYPANMNGVVMNRELSFAKTKLEESVMWAVKGITA